MSINELEHPHIFRMPDINMSIDERGVGYVLFHKMHELKEKIIQVDGITGTEDTYNSFLQRCIQTAIVMQEKGIKANDIIGICSDCHLNEVVPYFAALFLGAYTICYNPLDPAQKNVSLMEQLNVPPKLLFVDTNSIDFAKAVFEKYSCEIVVYGCTTEYTPFEKFLQPSVAEDGFKPYEAESSESIALMQFSSGSSGLRKLVCISHYAFLGRIHLHLNCNDCYDRVLLISTLNWITSILYYGIVVMTGGLRIILPKSKYDGNKLLHFIHLYKPTLLFLGRYLGLLVNPTAKDDVDITSLKSVGIIGSVLTKEQYLWLKSIFPRAKVYSCYGSTETGRITYPRTETTKEVEFFQSKVMSCGTLLVGQNYKVVNPETEDILGPNEIGELRIKSKFTASCYYNMDLSKMFDRNGWLKTGDLVYYDTDRYFYVMDRLNEVIRVRGVIVYPVVIEHILLSHPSVKEVVVVGRQDLIDGEQPVAVTVLIENSTATEDELVKFVDEKVDDTKKLVGGVIFVDAVPLTASGKISRYLAKKYVTEIEQKKLCSRSSDRF